MSKELEALEYICKILNEKSIDIKWLFKEQYNTIEQALQELQAIKSAEPSEALNQIDFMILDCIATPLQYEALNTVKQTLLKAQKQEKVLSIIIKKNVSVWGFRNRVFGYQKEQNGNITVNDTYEYYLNMFGCYHQGFDIELLTEEEFNTVKEWMK